MTDEITIILMSTAAATLGVIAGRLWAGASRWSAGAEMLAGVVLIAAALFHFAPEVLHMGGAAPYMALVGASVALIVDAVLARDPHDDHAGLDRGRAGAALGVLAVHSTLDGALYALSFGHDHSSGLFAAAGLLLHELPEGAAAAFLAAQFGWRPARVWSVAILASALTTPAGWYAARAMEPSVASIAEGLFAMTAGILSYIGLRLVVRALWPKRGLAK
ncbi:hypothetical protein GC169_05190 [bacterium]|nr:hypothetical protein [bacterium]